MFGMKILKVSQGLVRGLRFVLSLGSRIQGLGPYHPEP